MRVRLTEAAEADIEAILAYIAERNPAAVEPLSQAIFRAVEGLGDFPLIGREGRVSGTRERPLSRYPYILIYRLYGEQVFVARVVHGRQQWPPQD